MTHHLAHVQSCVPVASPWAAPLPTLETDLVSQLLCHYSSHSLPLVAHPSRASEFDAFVAGASDTGVVECVVNSRALKNVIQLCNHVRFAKLLQAAEEHEAEAEIQRRAVQQKVLFHSCPLSSCLT